MRDAFAAVVISGALSIPPVAPVTTVAAAPAGESTALDQGSNSTAARHATRGTVKSIDATTVVIARAGNRGEMTFELSRAIHLEGTIDVGTTVSVRYKDDGTKHVATAITVEHPAQLSDVR